MIVYQSTVDGFLDDAFKRDIEDVVLSAFRKRTGRSVSRNELRSWKESLVAVAKVLNDDSIPRDFGVAIEYGIPQTAKRNDSYQPGLEVGYVGVIIGPDLIVRNNAVETRPERRSRHDKSLNGYKKLLRTAPDEARD